MTRFLLCPSKLPLSDLNSPAFGFPVKSLVLLLVPLDLTISSSSRFLFNLCTNFIMGVLEQLNRKSGVIVGDDVLRLFQYAQEKEFAIPAIVSTF